MDQTQSGTPAVAVREVALVGVVDDGLMPVELALDFHTRVVDGGLEVAVLRVNHHPHIALHDTQIRHECRLQLCCDQQRVWPVYEGEDAITDLWHS